MTNRDIVRHRRRTQINSIMSSIDNFSQIISAIFYLPPHLRSTCVLDIEEYFEGHDVNLLASNPWWQKFGVKKLYHGVKEKGLL